MQKQAISWLVLTVGAVWLLSPALSEMGGVGQTEPVPMPETDAGPDASFNWYAGNTVLERHTDGHFYADANADGANVHFLVDTGASVVALTRADAEAMGLMWDEADLRTIGYGASGPVYGIPTIVGEMEVGGFTARNVSAAIIPEGLHISLLGQSFLSNIGNVEIRDDQMVLNNN